MKASRRGGKPKTIEVWSRLAAEYGGQLDQDRKGRPRRLTLPHRQWSLVLDSYTVSTGTSSATYTRLRALFVRGRDFRLRVVRRNPFHALGRLVGVRAVRLGYGRLDRALFVRSEQPSLTRSLLRGTAVGQALLADPRVRLTVIRPGKRIRRVAGEAVGEVQLQVGGKLRDLTRLRAMIGLCTETLDQLHRLDLALDEPVVGVEL